MASYLTPEEEPAAPAPTGPGRDTGSFLTPEEPKPPRHYDWADVPGAAYNNIGKSAGEFLGGLQQTVLHPIDTAAGLGKAGVGAMQLLGDKLGVDPERAGFDFRPEAQAVGQRYKDKYGSLENIKRSLAEDPIGTAADISALVGVPESAAARLGMSGTARALGTARAVTDPLTYGVTLPAKAATKLSAITGGLETGAGLHTMEEAFRAGQEGGQAQRAFTDYRGPLIGNAKKTGADLVQESHDSLKSLIKNAGQEYDANMGVVRQSQRVLPWNGINQAISDMNRVQNFQGIDLLTKKGQKARQDMNTMILGWQMLPPGTYHTAAGLDALKKQIGNYIEEKNITNPSQAKIATAYYNAVKDTITRQAPQYAQVMQGYEDAMNQVKEIKDALSLPRNQKKTNIGTALGKLQSTLRTNVNTRYGDRARVLDFLEDAGGKDLRASIAGLALKQWEPHGLARFNLLRNISNMGVKDAASVAHAVVGLPLSSPRITGAIANRAGQISRLRVPGTTIQLQPAIRRGITPASRYNPEDENGRLYVSPGQSRGGAVARALRIARH